MKKSIFTLCIFVLGISHSQLAKSQPPVWELTLDQEASYSQMAETQNGYLFVTDAQYIQMSTTNGSNGSWNPVSGYPVSSGIYYNLFAAGNNIFMVSVSSFFSPGTYPRGVFASTDFGATWTENNTGLGADSANTDNLIAMANGVLLLETGGTSIPVTFYRSTDGGKTWAFDYQLPAEEMGASVNVISATEAYMCTGDDGFYKSTDNGQTWTMVSQPPFFIQNIVISGGTFYSSSGLVNGLSSMYKSTDKGVSWSQITTVGISDSVHLYNLTVTPADTFYGVDVNNANAIYYSTNNCVNWNLCNNGIPSDSYLNGMYLSKSGYLFTYLFFGGVYRSTNRVTAPTTGVEDIKPAISAEVFPNPFSDYATIKLGGITGNTTLTIYDMLGNEARKAEPVTGSEVRINRNGLAPGVYFYTIMSDNQVQASGKLMVQ